MRPRVFTSILLFISAYSPLFAMLTVKDFNFAESYFKHPAIDFTVLGICALSIVVLFAIFPNMSKGSMVVTVKTVKSRSLDVINYTIPYLFCAWDIKLSDPADITILVTFFLMLLILTINTQSIFINPLLAIFGYSFYDLDYEYNGQLYSTVVISHFDMKSGERYYVRSLTRFLYLIKEKE